MKIKQKNKGFPGPHLLKKTLAAFTLSLSLISATSTLYAQKVEPTDYEGEKVHPHRFLVIPKKNLCEKTLAQTLPEGGRLTELLHIPPTAILETKSEKPYQNTLQALIDCGQFDLVEPDYQVKKTTSDSALTDGTLWGLKNLGTNNGTVGMDINVEPAWAVTKGAGAIVGVIDSGVLYTHQELAINMWVNPNEIPNNGIDDDKNGVIDDVHGINAIYEYGPEGLYKGDVLDTDGHGTHVAATIAAAEGSGPIVGVAPQTKIMALKFMEDGSGWISDAITCLNYAVAHGAHVTNNSWGWEGTQSIALRRAIKASTEKNIPFVAAAGNYGKDNKTTPFYPAAYADVISVSAIDRNGAIPTWSNIGATLGAPGHAIYSATASSNSSYGLWSGTSMAAPHVSGVLALLQSHKPNLSYQQKLNTLYLNLQPLPPLTGNTTYGGIPNAHKTLTHNHTIPPQTPPNQKAPPSPAEAPKLSAPNKKKLLRGQNVTLAISASNNPTSYGASNLPSGLSLNPFSGVISGIPTQRNKTVRSSISAQNAAGSDSKIIEFQIKDSNKKIKKNDKKQKRKKKNKTPNSRDMMDWKSGRR